MTLDAQNGTSWMRYIMGNSLTLTTLTTTRFIPKCDLPPLRVGENSSLLATRSSLSFLENGKGNNILTNFFLNSIN